MTRARATALVLVNWKGVFYERYLLDRHVTSLEGANGAGKTTVMIAAYVVLLPDMSRLRFTNLGESGATGGDRGIWGRLGELGRPSYAALELELAPGERVVFGVHLERKAEPTVTPTAFRIDRLGEDVRLQDLFLVKQELEESVPKLEELALNAEKLGAKLEVFRSVREYFEELFERGISPLRLANDDDRSKLNEMLRTSMTGGISRALTSELRTFLFREETGLSDALSRMRANLDTCRRSRTEVFEAQRLQRELHGVFEAGQSLLCLALLAARKQVLELSDQAGETLRERDRAADRVRAIEHALVAASERERELRGALERTKEERTLAAEALGRVVLARECSARIDACDGDQQRLQGALEAARAVRDGANAGRERARRLRHAAQDGLARAAAGLSRLESGLEELARRAHEHRAVLEQLALARELLGTDVDGEDAHAQAERARARVRELDGESARCAREIETASLRRADFERALHALRELSPGAGPDHAFEAAQLELARSVELEVRARALAELEREHGELSKHAVRRKALVDQAAGLGIALSDDDAISVLNAAWSGAERVLVDSEHEVRRLDDALRDARQGEQTSEARRRAVELRSFRYRDAGERLARIGGRLGEELDLEAAHRVHDRLAREQDGARERMTALRVERERSLELAVSLEAARGPVSSELLRISDELEAELCATRFDDLEPEAAAEVEARLGPLTDALLVLDPAAAASALAGAPREISEVILISPDALRARLAGSELVSGAGADLVVEHEGVVRVTRKPETSKLGRRARAARARSLRERAESIAVELEQLRESHADLEALSRELERVLTDSTALGSDPAPELARVEAELVDVRLQIERLRDALACSHDAERLARQRVLALRGLVAQSSWLGQRAGERSLSEIGERLEQARAARAELERTGAVRRVLSETLEALRNAPLTEADVQSARADKERLDVERDRLFRAAAALEYVADHRPALAFDEAEKALSSEAAVAPSLQAEHERSRAALAQAEHDVEAAEREWETATRAFQQAEGEHLAVLALLAREREELGRLTAGSGSTLETDSHRERMRELDERLAALGEEERSITREVALLSERLERERVALGGLVRAAERTASTLRPMETRLLELSSRVEAEGVGSTDAAEESRTSAALWIETRGKRELLLERLERARGGHEPAKAVRELVQASPVEADGLRVELEIWTVVRDWLLRCLPSRVTQTHDAIAAVGSLRQHLGLLEDRLARQEAELRGASEDVARGIDVQIRRAQGQVRRLNQHLTGVRFGSIRGMRIRIGRVERMEQVLRALREGATQELLFQPDLPIEEALNEIFRRHGGGKSGAQRLLDYREYLDLGVEVTRKEGASFEPANPTRLSTGEAIGVGAALMMVVLTEWERDANLLRGKRAIGSLRFLFLDEANRLSQDNLGVLFDLCQALDLQLLIAAPEVARAEGNTTYRLVRTRAENGVEEVIVSGRKGIPVNPPGAMPAGGFSDDAGDPSV